MIENELTEITTLIGFDYGIKSTGVALGDTLSGTARPLTTIRMNNGEPDWHEVFNLISRWDVEGCVVGIPINMAGEAHEITGRAQAFMRKLSSQAQARSLQLPVWPADERQTSLLAREQLYQSGGKNKLIKKILMRRLHKLFSKHGCATIYARFKKLAILLRLYLESQFACI